jgi:hypothetical protein
MCIDAEVHRCRGGEEMQMHRCRCRCAEVLGCKGAKVQRCKGANAKVKRCSRDAKRCKDAKVQGCRGEEGCRGAMVQMKR